MNMQVYKYPHMCLHIYISRYYEIHKHKIAEFVIWQFTIFLISLKSNHISRALLYLKGSK